MAQIQVNKYSNELQEQIFPDNSFYKKSISESGLASDAKTFEIPNAGTVNAAKRGTPTILPLKVVKNDDGSKLATMHLLYCDPILIEDEEEFVTNYNKRQMKQRQQASSINTGAADYAAYQWGPTLAANIIVSTGAARATNVAGLTGTRKAITKADFLKMFNKFLGWNALNVPGEVYALVTPDAYTDLLAIDEFVDYNRTGNANMLALGIVGKIAGINIMTRSQGGHVGVLYSAAGAKLEELVTAATDRPTNLFWHSGMTCSAEANPLTYVNEGDATYLGTIINSTVRFGAEICRNDGVGTAVLVEVA